MEKNFYKSEYLRLLREVLVDYKHEPYVDYIPVDQSGVIEEETLCKKVTYDPLDRFYGKDWPRFGVTMVGLLRLQSLEEMVVSIVNEQIEGDFFEAGVWRGGASIYMQALNRAYSKGQRKIWLADSFQGLPAPSIAEDEGYDFSQFTELSIPESVVRSNFKKYHLDGDNLCFVKGWFKDTLPTVPVESIAILRLDGDLYESTIDILNNLYKKVSKGGYIIVDDYSLDCCKKAIADFREKNSIEDPIIEIDWTGAYWRKS